MILKSEEYPFAQELITDAEGRVSKVVIALADYQRILEAMEDEGLHRAMLEVQGEISLTREEALKELGRE
jgi:RelB Antitoxin alpha helical domain